MCENYQERESPDSFSKELYTFQELGIAEPESLSKLIHCHDWLKDVFFSLFICIQFYRKPNI